MILADSCPLIRSANVSRNFEATSLTRCAIGVAPPTSISQDAASCDGWESVSFTHQKVSFFSDQLT